MFKDFSSLHPLAVHFPIVLILLAAVLQAVLVWKDLKQIKWVTLVIMAGAFFSSLAASTIFHAEPSTDAPKAALEIFVQHEKYAQLTLWTSGITLLLKCIGVFFKINRRSFEIIVLVSAVIAAVFLSIAGHHGAKLTHVAGVGPMGKYLMKGHGAVEDMEGMDMKNDSELKMNDTMPGMNTMDKMSGMDTKKMDSSMSMKDMVMPGMSKSRDIKDMKGMKNMPGMKGMDEMKDMKDMPGVDKMKMDSSMNMKDMKDMKMDSSMKDMNNMPGMDKMKMDSSMNMKDIDMSGMGDMKMPVKNPMDTLRFPDNNPGRKKNYKQNKQ
ncbi:MAG: hypothetical protein J0H85_04265 [Sediminibacterium magnilacihabitans]|jgi:uncharacterized membrane protein|nr:hypothetical protein [Sediminibacterium magnilacihabitans]PQV61888.1 putative membrane protein [Sediminibacterium magnilacihabitans]